MILPSSNLTSLDRSLLKMSILMALWPFLVISILPNIWLSDILCHFMDKQYLLVEENARSN
jgi:hypothetical protein